MVFVIPVIEETLPPLEIVLPSSVVEEIGIDEALPKQGVPIKFPIIGTPAPGSLGGQVTWDDVFGYIQDAFPTVTPAAQLNLPNVIQAFQKPMERQVHALASYTNLLQDFVKVMGAHTFGNDKALKGAIVKAQHIIHNIDARQNGTLNGITTLALPSLQAQITKANRTAYQLALNALKLAQVWTTEHIYIPLDTKIATERVQRQAAVDKITKVDIPAVHTDLLAKLAPVITAAAAAAKAASAVQQWVDDCGEPMCQSMGPKTNLGKLLKGLNLLADAGLIAEIAALNETKLQELITASASHVGNLLDTFSTTFVDGGGTLLDVATQAGL